MIFITGQVFINYKHGVVFSPFFHYGMYSEVITPKAGYNVIEVYANEELLAAKDYSPQEWDKIIIPVDRFYNQQKWNSNLFKEDIHRILPFTDPAKFTNDITQEQFNNWYKQQLEHITGKKVDSFKIVFTDYTFNGINLNTATP